jgi:hypothetical protein
MRRLRERLKARPKMMMKEYPLFFVMFLKVTLR